MKYQILIPDKNGKEFDALAESKNSFRRLDDYSFQYKSVFENKTEADLLIPGMKPRLSTNPHINISLDKIDKYLYYHNANTFVNKATTTSISSQNLYQMSDAFKKSFISMLTVHVQNALKAMMEILILDGKTSKGIQYDIDINCDPIDSIFGYTYVCRINSIKISKNTKSKNGLNINHFLLVIDDEGNITHREAEKATLGFFNADNLSLIEREVNILLDRFNNAASFLITFLQEGTTNFLYKNHKRLLYESKLAFINNFNKIRETYDADRVRNQS